MYNGIERCTNYVDYDATTGDFNEIFGEILYGYFFDSRKQKDGKLTFELYFSVPFDDEYYKKYGDCNGFHAEEKKGFENIPSIKSSKDLIQELPLQYDDHRPACYHDTNHNCEYDRVKPEFSEACSNNIYGDKRTFFKRLLTRKNPYQIKEVIDRSMLYKVTFDLPFDTIAEHITVDKILRDDTQEKTKSIYSKTDTSNTVENLLKKMQRMISNLSDMEYLISIIRNDPKKFKQDHKKGDEWAEECRAKGFNIENAEFLLKKVKNAVEKMRDVLFQARYFDIKAEPEEIEDTKCSHELCNNKRETGSRFCNLCVQLPTIECNFCNKNNPKR